MITKAFAVYDSKALCYGVPFFSPQVGSAVRSFSDACKDVNTSLNKHPGDYQLYEIGEFDDNSCVLSGLVPIKLLGSALDFVDKPVVYRPAVCDVKAVQNALDTVEELSNGK